MSDERDIPECGFIESPDGSITWGSRWEPSPYSSSEPVCIIYHFEEDCGAWIPFSVFTRDPAFDVWEPCCHRVPEHVTDRKRCSECGRKGKVVTRRPIDEHDCDWIPDRGLYHHESGGGCGDASVGGYAEPADAPARIWIAEGEIINGWDYIDGKTRYDRALTDDGLLARGYKRVYGPTPDPFAWGTEGDTFYDERTGERVPDEDGEFCCVCDERFVGQDGDIIVLDEYEADDDESPGLHRPSEYSWERGEWIAPLPHSMTDWGEPAICPKCAAETIADFGLRGLLDAWREDADAMPDDHREALLDAVRERVDPWIEGWPERREDKVLEWQAPRLAPRLGVTDDEMRVLCEEAGYR